MTSAEGEESISIEEFQRVQNEVLRLKNENHSLAEQLKNVQNTGPSFLSSFFSSSESTEIEKVQQEEAELKKTLANVQEKNDALREQCRDANSSESTFNDQVNALEALFMTKKRELTRMEELNASTLTDLEEEVSLARELCESLENGRASLARDKEVIENSIVSLQAAKQSIDARTRDLEQLNQQLKSDLGVKTADGTESADLASQIEEAVYKLKALEREYQRSCITFDAQEEELKRVEQEKSKECAELDEQRAQQTAKVEEQLKSLRHELQSLKSRDKADETVEIDIDSLVTENEELQRRIDELEKKRLKLAEQVNDNQVDCFFLGQWVKKEQSSHTDADVVFKELIQKQCKAREELAKLKESVNNLNK
ncbi:hypothetical protein TRFO_11717 [Tritrichomonas foetus]|uniref:Uncharacterized protein n=1 Tax=Tritrichomonas foetus TaxID=1144522 RepID=A0A1J4J784_9EUKA|nr:hypothetical protein TRFO_11717 [Tritrichomonas foetus]|eukprot:OHS93515.1 hypothetical protein TRFO_11717 [Tritrichomonas foetus]